MVTQHKPMNQFPLWKNILIVVVLAASLFYSLPNVFGKKPAVQVSNKNNNITNLDLDNVKKYLSSDNVKFDKIFISADKSNISMVFDNIQEQMKARKDLKGKLDKNYIIAMNMLSNTPSWLSALGAEPMNLGLDLRGGVYLMLEADTQSAVNAELNNALSTIADDLNKKDIEAKKLYKADSDANKSPSSSYSSNGFVTIAMSNKSDTDKLVSYLVSDYKKKIDPELSYITKSNNVYISFSNAKTLQIRQSAISQVVTVMRNRVNALGVAEASVAQAGQSRVVIEIPGMQDATHAKQILGGTSTANFYIVKPVDDILSAEEQGYKVYKLDSDKSYDQNYILEGNQVAGGSDIINATPSVDQQTGSPIVRVQLDRKASSHFRSVTSKNIGNPMGVMLVNTTYEKTKTKSGKVKSVVDKNEKLINVATIQSALGSQFQITGLQQREANNLALMIKSGALQVPVHIVQEQQIGPSLGKDNIKKGFDSIICALLVLVIFIAIYYRLFGIIANIALVFNLVLIVAVMSIIPGATLTLPGIAGIVLNLGMSIDGNVLIFERIREEIRAGTPRQKAIHLGYERAFATIVDSNITTLIVAVVLFFVGSGAVKGFAVTLIIGIATSMFTSVTVSRAVTNFVYGKKKKLEKLSIGI